MARRPPRTEDAPNITALGVVAPPPLYIEAPAFQGSLATLFLCVREQRLNLLDVPLAPVCEAYFLYLANLGEADLDEAAAALVALAYLLERKAWTLLPTQQETPEIETPLELPPPSVGDYALAMEALRVFHEERANLYFRNGDDERLFELPIEIENADAALLTDALAELLRKAQPEPPEMVHRARRSLGDMMRVVLMALTVEWRPLHVIIPQPFTREDAVYWFLSILELIRLGQAGVRREGDVILFGRAQA